MNAETANLSRSQRNIFLFNSFIGDCIAAMKYGEVALVLDVDSDSLNDFDETDKLYLSQVMSIIEKFI